LCGTNVDGRWASESNHWRIAYILGFDSYSSSEPWAYGYNPLRNEVYFFNGIAGYSYRYQAYPVAGRQYNRNLQSIDGPMTYSDWRRLYATHSGGWW